MLYRKKLVSLHTEFKIKHRKNRKNNRKMTKADIVNEVSLATGMPKKEVGIVVEAFMDAVKERLLKKKENV